MRTGIGLSVLLLALGSAAFSQGAQPAVYAAPDETTAANMAFFERYATDHSGVNYAEDAVFHDITLPQPIVGREAIAAMFHSIYVDGFPDARPEVQSMTAVGDRLVLQFIFHGTNTGPLFGNEPTGRSISVPMLAVYDIENELIREAWLYYDGGTYARQIGWIE